MERDPEHIARTLKMLRKRRRWTQENLAEAANISTRTIEKAESGRHSPDEQTLRSIARALSVDACMFEKPTVEQETRQRAEMERASRKTMVVATRAVRTASDVLNVFRQRHAFRIDTSTVENDEALEAAAAMTDLFRDWNDVWSECSMSQRLEYAREFAGLCQQIERHGYLCFMGHHRQRLCEKGKADLVFDVGLMSIQPKEGPEPERYALVELEGAWETIAEDRSFP